MANRRVRSRLSTENRAGTTLFVLGIILAVLVYIAVQFPVRAAEWSVPNTIGGIAGAVVFLTVARAGIIRMAVRS